MRPADDLRCAQTGLAENAVVSDDLVPGQLVARADLAKQGQCLGIATATRGELCTDPATLIGGDGDSSLSTTAQSRGQKAGQKSVLAGGIADLGCDPGMPVGSRRPATATSSGSPGDEPHLGQHLQVLEGNRPVDALLFRDLVDGTVLVGMPLQVGKDLAPSGVRDGAEKIGHNPIL